jgi:hypothetical protein
MGDKQIAARVFRRLLSLAGSGRRRRGSNSAGPGGRIVKQRVRLHMT